MDLQISHLHCRADNADPGTVDVQEKNPHNETNKLLKIPPNGEHLLGEKNLVDAA